MPAIRVTLHRGGMRQLLRDPGVAAELVRRMAPVLAEAKASAPVGTGAYQASLFLWVTTTDRAVARVGSDQSYAMAVEANHGVLGRALDLVGGEAPEVQRKKIKYKTKDGRIIMATQAQITNWTRGR